MANPTKCSLSFISAEDMNTVNALIQPYTKPDVNLKFLILVYSSKQSMNRSFMGLVYSCLWTENGVKDFNYFHKTLHLRWLKGF